MNNLYEMRKLINELNRLTKLYNAGTPEVSDKEWDDLYFKLVNAEKENGVYYSDSPTQTIVYQDVDKLQKVTHNHPMLSLDKTKDIKVLESFIGDKDVLVMAKLDGLTCSLKYNNGKLVSAETRGNGIEGEDVTHNIVCVKGVPHEIPFKDELIVDGEIICDLNTFNNNFAQDYKNARNYAAGAIRRLHSTENKDCGLSFIAWDCIKGIEEDTLREKLETLAGYGFDIVNFIFHNNTFNLMEAIDLIRERAQIDNIPIDGVVVKYDDCAYYDSLGHTDHHFRGGLAYKFYDEEYETRLKYINYDVSRTGVLTPVAVFEPVEIDGTIVERASLHNMSVMADILGNTPYAGEPIWVIKANQIIPQITKATKMDYGDIVSRGGCTVGLGGDYGIRCPICGGLTCIVESESGVKTLMCDNEDCPGKLAQRIDHYCSKKGLDIKGLSRKTIEKLIDWGWVNSIKDIYTLQQHEQEWAQKPGFGVKSVVKIISSIYSNMLNKVELSNFISALGIPLVGKTVANEITKYYETWDDFRSAVGGDWTEFDGFGPEISRAINNFDYTEADEIAAMLDFIPPKGAEQESPSELPLKDMVFCVTGKLKNYTRDSIKEEIEKNGGKVASGVTSKVNYLVTNTPDSGTAKNKDAQKLNIPIITEEQYMALIQK